MGKTALLFPGQASQYAGMGRGLYERFTIARSMYETANTVLGFDIARLSFEGPPEQLVQTANTQPAIFVHSCIAHELASKQGLTFDVAAGHSLGEYSALVVCGVLSFEDALTAVKHRARFMQDACEANPGTMAAVLGLDFGTVVDVCARASSQGVVVAANYNAANQIAISGSLDGVRTASALASEAGAKRVIPLPVGGAFHSPLMRPSPEQLAPVLDRLIFRPAHTPVILNVTARPTTDPAEIKNRLIEQLTAPVMWYPTVLYMKELGVDRAIEAGPKKVLCALVKGVLTDASLQSLDTAADFDAMFKDTAIARPA